MANNKDFKVKNGIQPTVYHEGLGTVVSSSVGYSISSAVYDNKSFDVSAQETGGSGIFLKPDGTKVYICGFTGDEINEYDLSTAYDISTASFNQLFSISAQETSARQVFFKSDGTVMYVIGVTSDTVYQYTLSTAWDISTASYASKSFSVSSQDAAPAGLSFKSDGTKMYISGSSSGNNVYQYSLSTAWDVSTASYDSVSFSTTGVSNLRGIWLSSDGTVMYLVDANGPKLAKATLSTAWDISTATMTTETLSVSSQDLTIYNVYGNSDGTKFYLMGSGNDTIYQYSTTQTTAELDLSTGSVFEITPTSDIQINLSNPADSGTVSQATLLLSGGATGYYDIANASYDSKNLSVSAQSGQPYDVRFKTDGTALYVVDPFVDKVFQYTLTTAWDVSTGSYASKSFTTTTQDGTPLGFDFKSDGTKMYIVGATNQAVFQYSLSTAWDVSTASYDSVSLSVTSQDSSPRSAFFKSDGTKLYIMGNTNQSIFQYSLSTAWDLSTASYDSKSFSVSGQDTNPQGVFLNSDGTKVFMQGVTNGDVYQYSLSTAYDISTASYDSVSFDLNSQIVTPFGVAFKPDGTKMYSAEFGTGEAVYQYSTAAPATITYPSTLEWPSGTAPTSPAIGETDVITFSTTDGGTTYQAVQAISGAS